MHRVIFTAITGETFEDQAEWSDIMAFVLGEKSYWKFRQYDNAKGKLVSTTLLTFSALSSAEVFENDLTRKRP